MATTQEYIEYVCEQIEGFENIRYRKMFGEYIVFFSIFILLRSYAGGLHLNRFLSCFVCSCFVEIATLLFAKNYQFPSKISFFIILGMT